jgi:hypothetical protein
MSEIPRRPCFSPFAFPVFIPSILYKTGAEKWEG